MRQIRDALIQQPLIKRIALNKHINPHNHVIGGWVLGEMDYACGILGETVTKGPIATVAITEVKFLAPLLAGDFITVYCTDFRIGKTSLTIDLEVRGEKPAQNRKVLAVTGTFVMVAIDEHGTPRQIDTSSLS